MEKISLHSNSALDVTVIPNIFIDKYMPSANGAYVKVYLYLLRCLSSPHSNDLSISGIADSLDHTENDIIRALCYWEKVNLLNIVRTTSNQISGITFNTLDNTTASDTIPQSSNNHTNNSSPLSKPRTTTASFSDAINKEVPSINTIENKDVEFVTSIAEKYIERILTPNDEQLILYLYTKANFSSDLILELYEYCASQGKKHYRYIETVADAWIKNGIDTVEKAKASMQSFNSYYNIVTKEFGINRPLGQSEKDFIDKWINTYSFDISIIKEACKRTILTIQKPDFKYTERILNSWYQKNVHSLNDITVLDKNHSKTVNNTHTAQSPKNVTKYPAPKVVNNRFNAFSQRSYSAQELDELEKRLLSR